MALGWASIQWKPSVYQNMSVRDVLAHVIQGESASPAGQWAVATVMQNRLQAGNFGSDLSKVVQPSQFNGWQTPTPHAYQLADALVDGTLSGSPQAGNALYFAAPAAGNASWTQSLLGSNAPNIGGNYFSDVAGAPTQNFTGGAGGGFFDNSPSYDMTGWGAPSQSYNMPQVGSLDANAGIAPAGESTQLGMVDVNGTTGQNTFQDAGYSFQSVPPDQIGMGGPNASTVPIPAAEPSGLSNPYGGLQSPYQSPVQGPGQFSQAPGEGVAMPQGAATAPGGQPDIAPAGGEHAPGNLVAGDNSAGSAAGAGGAGAGGAGGGASSWEHGGGVAAVKGLTSGFESDTKKLTEEIKGSTEKATQSLDKNVSELNKTAEKTTTALNATTNQALGAAAAQGSNWLVRGALIAVGLIFVAQGLSMFRTLQGVVPSPVRVTKRIGRFSRGPFK